MTLQEKNVIAYYDGICDVYDKQYRVENDFIDLREREVFEKRIGNVKASNILDFGCGTGRFSLHLLKKAPQQILAVDISPGMIKRAQSKCSNPRIEFRVYYPAKRHEPFDKNIRYNIITCIGVIEYQNNIEEFFTVVRNNLAMEGLIFFDFINRTNPFGLLKARFNKEWRDSNVKLYKAHEIRQFCENNNMEIISIDGILQLLLPKRLLSRTSFLTKLALKLERKVNKVPLFKYLASYRIMVTARRK